MRIAALALAAAATSAAQSAAEHTGFTFYERLDGTHNQLGLFTRLDSTVGYNFNTHFGIDAGLPVYFVRPSDSASGTLGMSSVNGIGNAHFTGRLSFPNPSLDYVTSFTVTAPTGSESKGLSTGHVTYDWNNHFDHTFGRLMPYADVGLANEISDTPFFVRPFISHGFVAHLEGGALVRIVNHLSLGGSGYAIEPSGEQTIISRINDSSPAPATTTPTPATPAPSQGMGQGQGRGMGQGRTPGVFEVVHKTVGTADIARDRGASAWVMVTPSPTVDFEIGYSRSTTYRLDTVFFGIGFNLASWIRR
jgi:hypothetical protein